MKYLIYFLMLPAICTAQMGVINDPDGYVNVREGKSATAKIVGRLTYDDLFLYPDPDDQLWSEILKDSTLAGYVHRSRIMRIDDLPRITQQKVGKNILTIQNDSIIFKMSIGPFQPASHKISKHPQGYIVTIDGKKPWGIDGDPPHHQINQFSILVNGKAINLPHKDLFEMSLEAVSIHFGKNGRIIVNAAGGDGAGGYMVAWLIKDGKLIKRYVDTL